jgi:hypothetical protein
MSEDELLLRMIKDEQRAPQQGAFARSGLGARCVLAHPGWVDPSWSTVEQACDGLLKRRLLAFGPKRTYVISEIGYEYYQQRLAGQPPADERARGVESIRPRPMRHPSLGEQVCICDPRLMGSSGR